MDLPILTVYLDLKLVDLVLSNPDSQEMLCVRKFILVTFSLCRWHFNISMVSGFSTVSGPTAFWIFRYSCARPEHRCAFMNLCAWHLAHCLVLLKLNVLSTISTISINVVPMWHTNIIVVNHVQNSSVSFRIEQDYAWRLSVLPLVQENWRVSTIRSLGLMSFWLWSARVPYSPKSPLIGMADDKERVMLLELVCLEIRHAHECYAECVVSFAHICCTMLKNLSINQSDDVSLLQWPLQQHLLDRYISMPHSLQRWPSVTVTT